MSYQFSLLSVKGVIVLLQFIFCSLLWVISVVNSGWIIELLQAFFQCQCCPVGKYWMTISGLIFNVFKKYLITNYLHVLDVFICRYLQVWFEQLMHSWYVCQGTGWICQVFYQFIFIQLVSCGSYSVDTMMVHVLY